MADRGYLDFYCIGKLTVFKLPHIVLDGTTTTTALDESANLMNKCKHWWMCT